MDVIQMAKEFAKAFYRSAAWKKCRESYIASVQGLCETCLSKMKINPGKILHHTIYLTPENINDVDVSLNWNNLRFDCQDCHNKEHHQDDEVTAEGLTFDTNGDLIQYTPL
jgi:5-methylcytosine-specific restriction endonuclease McrA